MRKRGALTHTGKGGTIRQDPGATQEGHESQQWIGNQGSKEEAGAMRTVGEV